MNLLESSQITQRLKEMQDIFTTTEGHVADLAASALQEVVSWKFATDEFFNPIPLQSELNRFSRGQIRKSDSTGHIYKRGIYSFGFNADQQLLATQYIDGEDSSLGVNFKTHKYANDIIFYNNLIHYPDKNFVDYLNFCGSFQRFSENIGLDIGVGRQGAFSIALFHYTPERVIERIERQATGWQSAVVYQPIYDDKGIKEITVGNVVWWKRAGKG
jgi:hypothetical protein